MAYFDPIGALVQLLTNKSTLATAVTRSSRVWIVGGQMPGTFDGGKGILVPGSGGPIDVTMTQRNVQIRCYGSTHKEATALWVTLMDALHDTGPTNVAVTGGTVTMGKARLIGGPEPGIEPETEWRYVLTLWDIIWYGRKIT